MVASSGEVSQLTRLRRNRESQVELRPEDRGLAHSLAQRIRGEVRFDAGSRALYARDASNFRMVPTGIVIPKDEADVLMTLELCREHSAPVLSRGGGTSLAGQCCNEAVIMDFTKYMGRVLEVRADTRVARVQPGTILDNLRRQAERYGLTFGPDPSTHNRCTLGGMIGNDSCGVHAVMAEFYGPGARVHDNVELLDVVTYDGCRFTAGPTSEEELSRIIGDGGRRGEIYGALRNIRDQYGSVIREKFPNISRRVSGYNLPSLLPENGFNVARALVGSEGTCVTVLGAELTLIAAQTSRVLLILGFPDTPSAGDVIPRVRRLDDRPIGCEGVDRNLIQNMHAKHMHEGFLELLPEGHAWLILQFGGDAPDEALDKAERARRALEGAACGGRIYTDDDTRAEIWQIRESGLGATAFVPGKRDTWPGWEDSAVPPDAIGPYLRELESLFEEFGYRASLYGHFAQGCVHTRIPFDLASEPGIEQYRRFTHRAAELVLKFGGSLSGEHGDGQQRGDLLPMMYGDTLMQAFREFKAAFDPEGKMNPGKLVDAAPRTENLALGASYHAEVARPETHFAFREDGGIEHATLRCVGVGECRRLAAEGVMCPSFMVLREEKHSTRGRAHLLHEMLRGEVIDEGWQSEHVKESLDLCLSCKGCTHDCPVSVDIPTLKAEFLAHYYEKKRRPRQAYALGWIQHWAPLGALVPELTNLATQTPGLRSVAKKLAGIHARRSIPRFAQQTFRDWYRRRRPPRSEGRPRVLLWPDTFNNHFYPEVLASATRVLEHAGCEVALPRHRLCCGRPLYDYGMLEQAKRSWRRVFSELAGEIEAGTPLLGVEPSCTAAFRDELVNLFPDDRRAKRLKQQTYTLAGYLQRLTNYEPPQLEGQQAVVHFHCHQQGVLGTDSDRALFDGMGLEYEQPHKTCCGMAGSFGFEDDKYELSTQIGELGLLPAIRSAPPETVIVADGFSCRSQVEQTTQRRPLHTAELVDFALRRHEGRLQDQAVPTSTPLSQGRASRGMRRLGVAAGLLSMAALSYSLYRRWGVRR